MNRLKLLMLCVTFFALAAGCQSSDKAQFRLQQRRITLKTTPEGARVWHLAPPTGDPVNLGMTPLIDQPVMVLTKLKVTVQDPSSIGAVMSEINTARLRIEKDGYKPVRDHGRDDARADGGAQHHAGACGDAAVADGTEFRACGAAGGEGDTDHRSLRCRRCRRTRVRFCSSAPATITAVASPRSCSITSRGEQSLGWSASSRGLAIGWPGNHGALSEHTERRLGEMNINFDDGRHMPLQCRACDLAEAGLVVALKEAEHRAMLAEKFSGWEDRVTYWHVHDVDAAHPEVALREIEQLVRELVLNLKRNGSS
jgi:protein-tyrosine phosphatase